MTNLYHMEFTFQDSAFDSLFFGSMFVDLSLRPIIMLNSIVK